MPRATFIISVILVFIAGAMFVLLNAAPLQVELLLARPRLTVGQWLLIILALGWLLGIATVWRLVNRLRRQRGELRRRLQLAESEIRILRTPVSTGDRPV